MNEAVTTQKYKNHIINIYYDQNPESPLEWDNLGQFICFHKSYNLGHRKVPTNYTP